MHPEKNHRQALDSLFAALMTSQLAGFYGAS